MTILCIAGGRGSFVRMASVFRALRAEPGARALLLHTGRDADDALGETFFRDLALPAPDIHLGVSGGTATEQTARILVAFEEKLAAIQPDAVVVAGDAASGLACALVAAKDWREDPAAPGGLRRPLLAHVEAGLRANDPTSGAEVNRILIDRLSDLLFTSCEDAGANLRSEAVPEDRIHFVGNVVVDTLLAHEERARRSSILRDLGLERAREVAPYAVLALQRPATVEVREKMVATLEALRLLSREVPVLFPAAPRALRRLEEHGLAASFAPARQTAADPGDARIRVLDPLGYLDFLRLTSQAKLVLTDSGPIQEEATVLGVPCLTLLDHTERPITLSLGTNVLVGLDPGRILIEGLRAWGGRPPPPPPPPFWDGQAGQRIARILVEQVSRQARSVPTARRP